MTKKLWEASPKQKRNSNLFEFEKFLAKKFNYTPKKNYKKLFNWTIRNPKDFWSSMWEFSNIKGIKNYKGKAPLINYLNRKKILKQIKCVDCILPINGLLPVKFI